MEMALMAYAERMGVCAARRAAEEGWSKGSLGLGRFQKVAVRSALPAHKR
jgi:hypothetical protein